jgi:hypothetical protein
MTTVSFGEKQSPCAEVVILGIPAVLVNGETLCHRVPFDAQPALS